MRTKYCVLGSSAIFLSNGHSLYAHITSDECHVCVYLYRTSTTCQRRIESDRIQNEKFLSTVGLELTTLTFVAWCSTDLATLALMELVLLKWHYDTNVYIGISSRMERILYCGCTVFAFNTQNTTKHSTWCDRVFWSCFESKHRTCASLNYLSIIDTFPYVTQNSSCTRQNTLYFIMIIVELIPIYKLVSEVQVFIMGTLIGQLSSKPG